MKKKYVPGVCNIGPAEIKRREQIGWYALAVTAVLGIILVSAEAPEWTKAILFIPATISALGFLQAWFSFCVAYGSKGLFNMSDDLTKQETVEQQEFREKDKQRAILIAVGACIIGLLITASAFTT